MEAGRAISTASIGPFVHSCSEANISTRRSDPLYVFGWLAPFTIDGLQVWVGQISRDTGIKLLQDPGI